MTGRERQDTLRELVRALSAAHKHTAGAQRSQVEHLSAWAQKEIRGSTFSEDRVEELERENKMLRQKLDDFYKHAGRNS